MTIHFTNTSKTSFRLLFVIGLVVISTRVLAIDSSTVQNIVARHGLNPDQLGIRIEDEAGTVFTLNDAKKLTPASLTKILTAGAALETLGSQFAFRTQLIADGPLDDGVLSGSLYLKGGGDPSFDSKKLPLLTAQLRAMGIRAIRGDIVIDETRFDQAHFDEWSQAQRWIRSLNPQGYPVFINLHPGEKRQRVVRALLTSSKRFVVYENMIEPDLWTGARLHGLLQEAGISIRGDVIRGQAPESGRLLCEIKNPLMEIISEMLKSSNNYYADLMTLNLAAEAGEKPATIERGMLVISSFLEHVGIGSYEYFFNSGAGYSHQNFISANALCKVLDYIRQDPALSKIFLSSLPIAGVDGTLERRMKGTSAQGRVMAKTGWIGGVVGMAGFASALDGKSFTFVFLYNGPRRPRIVRATFDQICVELTRSSTQFARNFPRETKKPFVNFVALW